MTLFIGLHGEAGSGKDTVGELLLKETSRFRSSVFLTSFAAPVYELAEALLGESLRTREGKEVARRFDIFQENLENMNDVFVKYHLDDYDDFPDIWEKFSYNLEDYMHHSVDADAEFALHISPRKILELVGTELGRTLLAEDVWLRTMYHSVPKGTNLVIVTDVRFNNEAELIRQLDGKIILILAPKNIHSIKSDHPSARPINASFITHTIANQKDGIPKLAKDIGNFHDRFLLGLY